MNQHKQIWDVFCAKLNIYEHGVPLFHCAQNLIVETKTIGIKEQRPILRRSSEMENMVCLETNKLIEDWKSKTNEFDGLIYMVFLKDTGKVLPLYIGKTETIGKGDGNLSGNIKNLHRDVSKFARWGDGYYYHIGDLSAATLIGHDSSKITPKYSAWSKTLFVEIPTLQPQLKQEVYFWTTAWKKTTIGIWEEFGSTRLTFLEYLMIGVASSVFPDLLLNREGQNRNSNNS